MAKRQNGKIFFLILERQVPAIVARAMVYSYQEQYAWCRWEAARSEIFPIMNGTQQGSMASPFLWAVYCDPLLARLPALGVGCQMPGCGWKGDDLVLLAPCRRAKVLMLKEAELWADEFNVTFSTDPDPNKSKSKLFSCVATTIDWPSLPPLHVWPCTHLGGQCHPPGP